MTVQKSFDVAVIGGGPGGYVAAIRAAQLGFKVVVIEKSDLGGICLNWGCIPTKALLRSAEVYDLIHQADHFGLKVEKVSFDLAKIVERSRNTARQLAKGIEHLLKKNKVTVLKGHGKILSSATNLKKIEVLEGEKPSVLVEAKKVILATGARARTLPSLPQSDLIWSYREAMVPSRLPQSLLVVGSGAIGIEFASFYRALGVDVTVVEVLGRILPAEDEEISSLAQKAFEKRGVKILTSTSLDKVDVQGQRLNVSLKTQKGQENFVVDTMITAVGIQANTEGLGLETTAIRLEKGHIITSNFNETDEEGVYAIGDVAATGPWLAHKASHEGVLVAEHIAGVKGLHPMNRHNIPGCTYSTPQIASVGLTEKKAIEEGYDVKVGRFPFMGNGKAIALGEPEGLVKTIFDAKTGELLGAHMVGAEVTEMIQGFVIAKTAELTEAEFMHTVFPHPTLSEMMHESVLSAYGRAIHF